MSGRNILAICKIIVSVHVENVEKLTNGVLVARTLKKLRTSKGDYWIKQ